MEAEFTNLKQVSDDVWLPQTQRITRFHTDTNGFDKKLFGTPKYAELNQLADFRFDRIQDQEFEVPYPERGQVTNIVEGRTYSISPKKERAKMP
jgi:hypothetical protein